MDMGMDYFFFSVGTSRILTLAEGSNKFFLTDQHRTSQERRIGEKESVKTPSQTLSLKFVTPPPLFCRNLTGLYCLSFATRLDDFSHLLSRLIFGIFHKK